MLTTNSDARKCIPLFSGLFKYFPDACCEVAKLSRAGSIKHNGPDVPMHWSRSKSDDHHDCLLRHLLECGTVDTDGFLHEVKVAWRAMAILQQALEKQAEEAANHPALTLAAD